ncbi:MAG: NUDIX domain-containing protein [Candidatus Hodarchaeota archaeon]
MNVRFCIQCGNQLISIDGEEWDFECSDCGRRHYTNPIPTVAALVFVNDEVVIVSSKRKDLWGLPGGFVQTGESLEMALVREVLEETGFHIRIIRFFASYPLEKEGSSMLFVVFLAEAYLGDPIAGDDVDEVLILPPDRAYEQLTGRLAKRALRTWIEEQDRE